jgi:hypothetical protein
MVAKRRPVKSMRKSGMKFHNSNGPHPRAVKMFMAEKVLDIPRVAVDLRAGENRQRLGARRARHVDT